MVAAIKERAMKEKKGAKRERGTRGWRVVVKKKKINPINKEEGKEEEND